MLLDLCKDVSYANKLKGGVQNTGLYKLLPTTNAPWEDPSINLIQKHKATMHLMQPLYSFEKWFGYIKFQDP